MEAKTVCLRILVVEDNPGDCVLLKKIIERTDLNILEHDCATSLKEANTALDRDTYDLVFLDLNLPDSHGVATFVNLHRHASHLPVIVLSGQSDRIMAIKCISMGAQDYLVKGEFDEKLLSKTVRYSIERKKILESLSESNLRYEYINKATNDTIWEWDYASNGGIWGEGIVKNFGYTSDHLIKTDQWIYTYLHHDDIDRVFRKIQFTLSNKLTNWLEEFRFRCADGSYRDILDRGFVIYDAAGSPYKMYGAMTDITEQRRLERSLTEQELNQQKLLTEATIDVQETERNMLGKELHDNINQILATAKMYISMARENDSLMFDDPSQLLDESYKHISCAIEEIRKLSKTLVTPTLTDMGLQEALETLIAEQNLINNFFIQLRFFQTGQPLMDSKKELMFYRIVQEQISNIRKHARATNVAIKFETRLGVSVLTIKDNGVGFVADKKMTGIGLRNIKGRVEFYGGQFSISSAPGKGCTLKISVPD